MNINELADLAQLAEVSDPIEWDYLRVDEKTAYRLMAASVIDIINNKYMKYSIKIFSMNLSDRFYFV